MVLDTSTGFKVYVAEKLEVVRSCSILGVNMIMMKKVDSSGVTTHTRAHTHTLGFIHMHACM